MQKTLVGALLLLASASPVCAQASAQRPSLFTRNDAIWAGAALLGSVALSTADVRIAGWWNDSTHRNTGRDRLARNFAKAQEGTLFIGNMALWGIARLGRYR